MQDLLDKKLKACDKRAAAYGPLRESWAAATLRLDAHRQVFETLINSMTTYRPVLTRIRQQYDAALDEALKVSYEGVHMQVCTPALRLLHALLKYCTESHKAHSPQPRATRASAGGAVVGGGEAGCSGG